jgi:hypothetical protein
MATNVPPVPPQGAPTPKKISPIVWILIAIAGLCMFVVIAVAALGFFAYHKAKQAGFDISLLEKKPELAFIKMAVAANPDAELVSIDEGRGIATVKDKKTGKVVTMNFEDLRKGRISFSEGGRNVTIETQGQGEQGSVAVTTEEGTTRIGAGVKLPAWLPAYSGAKAEGVSALGAGGASGGFGFKTADAPDKVASFFETELKKGGFEVELTKHAAGAMLTATSGGRKAVLNILADGSGSAVNGSFEDK